MKIITYSNSKKVLRQILNSEHEKRNIFDEEPSHCAFRVRLRVLKDNLFGISCMK